MKSRVAFPVLFALLSFSAVLPMQAQKTFPRYVPPPAPRPAMPRPAPRPATPRPAAPQHQNPTPQPAPQQRPVVRPAAPASVPNTNNQQRASRPQPAPVQPSRAQQQRQQKEDARAQKERVKQQQQAQKDQAKRQKEEAKQREKQQKEQARQEKDRKKQQEKADKEARKHQPAKSVAETAAKAPAPKQAEAPRPASSRSNAASAYRNPEAGEISGKTASGSTTLTRSGSESVMGQVNSARSSMNGLNRKPLPAGDVTVHQNGRLTVNAAGGRQYGVRANGTVASYRDANKSVSFDPNGKVTSLRSSNLDVRRGSHGERSIVGHGKDNATLVTTGRHSGYMERSVTAGNRTYIQRTTVINQRIVSRNFVAFNYGGVGMVRFVTPAFFAPGFYGWAFYPWGPPIPFAFGWEAAPWYGGPNPYFAAYGEYPGAAQWLADYAIGETLSDGYQLDADAELEGDTDSYAETSSDGDDSDQADRLNAEAMTPISAEIKESIVEQVKQELTYDSAASSAHAEQTGYDEVSFVLGTQNQVFVVSSSLDVSTADEQLCGLQAGDILQMKSAPASNSDLVQLRVASSKRRDCPAGVTVTVSMADLQEMHNNFRARVEAGLGELQAGQGHNGIPAAPASALTEPRTNIASAATVPESDVTSALEAQRQQADAAEAQAVDEAFSQGQ